MKLSDIKLSLQKELREVLRDIRALFIIFGVPLLVCPVFGLLPVIVGGSIANEAMSKSTRVALLGDNQTLRQVFQHSERIRLVSLSKELTAEQIILARKADVVVETSPDFDQKLAHEQKVQIKLIDSAFSSYLIDESNVITALDKFEDEQRDLRLSQYHIPKPSLERLDFKHEMIETNSQRSGYFTGFVCTLLLMLAMTMTSMYPALDVITGERERGTLVLLLLAPGDRRNVVVAKLLTVTILTFVGTLFALAAICITLATMGSRAVDTNGTFMLTVPYVNLFLSVLLFVIPLTVSISACAILISSYAKTFQQGQAYFVPLMFVGLIMTGLVLTCDDVAPFFVNFVPLANLLLCMHKGIQGQWNPLAIIATMASSAIFLGLLLQVSVSILDREESLFGIKQPPSRRTVFMKEAFVLFGIALAGFFYVGGTLQSLMPLWGILLSQVFVFGVPSLIVPKLVGAPWRRTLSLYRPKALAVLGALLVAPGMALVSSAVAHLQQGLVPNAETYIKALQDQVIPHGKDAWIGYITIALGPAVCEELLFRGAIQGMLRQAVSKPALVAIVAVLFGVLHGSSARFLPTTLMGAILSIVCEYTGSIFPSMIIHACNNALAVYQAQAGMADMSPPMMIGAVISTICGIAAMVASKKIQAKPQAKVS